MQNQTRIRQLEYDGKDHFPSQFNQCSIHTRKLNEYLILKKENLGPLTAVQRRFGEYCSNLEARSIASGGICF